MQTIRQALMLLRQNPLLSTIFILGTAFAITMIMAIVITWQMKYADMEPEVNRSRCLYISKMHLQGKENKEWNTYSSCSPAFMKECVQPLPEVEACTAFVPAGVALVSMPDGTNSVKVDAMETDPGFWKVFQMQFVAGRGFDDSDRGGDVSAIVISASVARKLFGTTDAVGKTVLLNRNEARVCGVVKDVSVIAKDAYAQVWRMYPAELQDAVRGVLIRQILNENLVLTLIGGVVGLVFSYLAVYGMRTWLFTNSQNIGTSGDFDLSMSVLFSPAVFGLAFLFCLVINLLSAGLPTWLAARHTIVDSLNDK